MTRTPDDDALPVVRAVDLDDGDTLARWLVDTLWARAAVGVLGGAPKCCKSWLALDLAVSVAAGTACLGAFDVDDPGPVLLYMAEDAAAVVKARLSGICRARHLDLASVPIHVITVPVLRLDRGRDQARLRDAVRRCAPRLLILDPFVRLHRIDENDAGEVSALLGYLRTLQRQHDVAVLVVHHARKNGSAGAQAGLSLRGSGDFHAWGDSNLYIRRQKDALVLTIEHRAAAAPDPLRLQLVAGDDADVHLAVIASDTHAEHDVPRDLDPLVLDALGRAGRALSRSQLRVELRVRNERLGDALVRLAANGAVVRAGDRWAVPVPTPQEEPGTERPRRLDTVLEHEARWPSR